MRNEERMKAPSRVMGDRGVYVYAFARGLSPQHLVHETGIGDAALRLVEQGDLAAVVSTVDLEEFGEEGLRRNLEDLAWLESVAKTHDRVARFAAERVPTAPLRLATVFVGEDSVRCRLAEWHDAAEEVLDRVEGHREWCVKAYADPAPEDPPAQERGPARAFRLRRRAGASQREKAARADAEIADDLHARLGAGARLSRRLPPQGRRTTMHTGEMVLNATYLVSEEQEGAFKDVVSALAETHDHVRVEVDGPWPPYSFATLEPGVT